MKLSQTRSCQFYSLFNDSECKVLITCPHYLLKYLNDSLLKLRKELHSSFDSLVLDCLRMKNLHDEEGLTDVVLRIKLLVVFVKHQSIVSLLVTLHHLHFLDSVTIGKLRHLTCVYLTQQLLRITHSLFQVL